MNSNQAVSSSFAPSARRTGERRRRLIVAGISVGVLFCACVPLLLGLLLPDRSPAVRSLAGERWEVCRNNDPQISSLSTAPSCWRAYDGSHSPTNLDTNDHSRHNGYYWLTAKLPEPLPESPLLLVRNQPFSQVYIGSTVDTAEPRKPLRRTAELDGYLMSLHQPDAGQTIWIRAYTNGNKPFPETSVIGNAVELYAALLQEDALKLVLTVLFLAAGIVSLCFYIANTKEPAYRYFSMLSLFLAYAGWVRSNLAHMVVDLDWLPYVHDLSLPLCSYAWIGYWESVSGDKARLSVTRMKKLALLFVLACLAVAGVSTRLYDALIGYAFPVLFISMVIVCFRSIRHREDSAYSPDIAYIRQSLTFGFSAVASICILHIAINYKTPLYGIVHRSFPSLAGIWGYDQVFLCAFVFNLCLGLILFNRFMSTYRRVQSWNVSLEEQVRERTDQLEESYKRLQASARETANTLAELSVVEERNRIAHEIHDVVGHTLTAAIIQLEAAKKQAGYDHPKALERMGIVSNLIRKGLDEIRRSVRMLKDEETTFELLAALHELIRETEVTMGVSIEAAIEPMQPLGELTQRVVYHALQEGLTNGIRHGRCRSFRFALGVENGWLTFRLTNDGIPYAGAKPGFGMTAMMERVQLLGGIVEIGPDSTESPDLCAGADDGGSFKSSADVHTGCQLVIKLPIAD